MNRILTNFLLLLYNISKDLSILFIQKKYQIKEKGVIIMMKRVYSILIAIAFIITGICPALAVEEETARAPRILVRSIAQEVNIGDVAQGPGVLALIEKYIPEAEVKVLSAGANSEIIAMLGKRFPNYEIIRGKFDDTGTKITAPNQQKVIDACEWADYFVQGSGPGISAGDIKGFQRISGGKPYGIFGVTYSGSASAQEMINGADFVYFRDSTSYRKALSDGVYAPVLQFGPDSAFAFDIKDDEKAEAFMEEKGLEEGKFMCLIPRYRHTPYWEIGRASYNESSDKTNQEYKEKDNGVLRETAIKIVDETGMKVVVCPEDETQIKLGQDVIIDMLPEGYEDKIVLHDEFWLPDEALSLYTKSAGVFGNEMHSPIISLGNGIPATVGRWSSQTSKGLMWDDIGLSDWLFDMDKDDEKAKVEPTVLAIAKDNAAAKAKMQPALATVKACQEDMTKTLKYFLTGEGKIEDDNTSKIGADSPELGERTGTFMYYGSWNTSSLGSATATLKSIYSKKVGAYASWNPDFREGGDVKIEVYKVAHSSSGDQTYEIFHNGQTSTKTVSFNGAEDTSGWVDLGTYTFAGTEKEYVKLSVTDANLSARVAEMRFVLNPGTENERAVLVEHKPKVMFEDTFDDSKGNERLVGWTLDDHTPMQLVKKPEYNEVTKQDIVDETNNCLYYPPTKANSDLDRNYRDFDPMSGIVTIEHDFRIDEVPTIQLKLPEINGLVGTNENTLLSAITVDANSNINIVHSGTSRFTYAITLKTWHHIKTQINTEANTFSVWIDGVHKVKDKQLYQKYDVSHVNRLTFYPVNQKQSTGFYIDNVLVYSGTQGQRTSVTSSEYTVKDGNDTIINVPYGTDAEAFKANVTAVDSGNISGVYVGSTSTVRTGAVQTGDRIVVKPQSGFNNPRKTTYTITVDEPLGGLVVDEEDISITNGGGVVMNSELMPLNKVFKANTTFANYTGETQKISISMALYSADGLLKAVEYNPVDIDTSGAPVTTTLTLDAPPTAGEKLKLFIWDEDMKPILEEAREIVTAEVIPYEEVLKIEAEAFYDKHASVGTQTGNDITWTSAFDSNRWLMYKVNFGMEGYSRISAHLGAQLSGRTIEVRLGTPTGTLIGTLEVTATGGHKVFETQCTSIESQVGVQDVYLVAKGGTGVANIDWIQFDSEPVPPDPVPEIINNDSDKITYSGMTAVSASGYENGDYHAGTGTSASYEFTFTGTGIDILAPLSPDGGEVTVTIDGVEAGTYNSYSEAEEINRTVFTKTNLAKGTEHTVKVENTGGKTLALDAIKVYTIPIKVACIGDSITAGTNLSATQKYHYFLAQLLGDGYEVKGYGVSGATALKDPKVGNSYWDHANFTKSTEFVPDVVIIMLGTNDTKGTNVTGGLFEDYYIDNLTELVNHYKNQSQKPRIYLNTSPSAFTTNADYNTLVSGELKAKITEVAEATGVNLIDVNAATASSEYFQTDGIHPNVTGAEAIAQAIYNNLPF